MDRLIQQQVYLDIFTQMSPIKTYITSCVDNNTRLINSIKNSFISHHVFGFPLEYIDTNIYDWEITQKYFLK